MKLKTGEEITFKEFMERWKIGIQKVTPYQTSKFNLLGNTFVLVGVILGILIMFQTKTYWLLIVLFGSLILVVISFIGMLQRYWALKKIEEILQNQDEL